MRQDEPDPSIGEIETNWADIFLAREIDAEGARSARARLMLSYLGAVRRYVRNFVGDADVADEVTQEFAIRFLRGDFLRADANRGRFRDLVRTSVRNMVSDYFRRHKVRAQSVSPEVLEAAASVEDECDHDAQFLQSWRQELSDRAWAALAEHQRRTGQPFESVLRLRVDHPELNSSQLAGILSARLGKPVTAGWVRQTLRRARMQLVDLLLDEIDVSLEGATAEELEQELIDLDLLSYCREGLRRRKGEGTEPCSRTPQNV
jgi:RNA polymerase sigma-70 factor (ECF subfamily)